MSIKSEKIAVEEEIVEPRPTRRSSIKVATQKIVQPVKKAARKMYDSFHSKEAETTPSLSEGSKSGDEKKGSLGQRAKKYLENKTGRVVKAVNPPSDRFYIAFDPGLWPKAIEGLITDNQLFWGRIVGVVVMALLGAWAAALPLALVVAAPKLPRFHKPIHMAYSVTLLASAMTIIRYITQLFRDPYYSDIYCLVYLADQLFSLEHPIYPVDLGIFYAVLIIYPSLVRTPVEWDLGMSARNLQLYILFYLAPIGVYPLTMYKKGSWNPPSFVEKVGRAWRFSRRGVRMSWDATQYIPT